MTGQLRKFTRADLPVRKCSICRDGGIIWLTVKEREVSAETIRQLLTDGEVCLCACEEGQWWLSWLWSMFEMYGHVVPTRGVPDNLVPSSRFLDDRVKEVRP